MRVWFTRACAGLMFKKILIRFLAGVEDGGVLSWRYLAGPWESRFDSVRLVLMVFWVWLQLRFVILNVLLPWYIHWLSVHWMSLVIKRCFYLIKQISNMLCSQWCVCVRACVRACVCVCVCVCVLPCLYVYVVFFSVGFSLLSVSGRNEDRRRSGLPVCICVCMSVFKSEMCFCGSLKNKEMERSVDRKRLKKVNLKTGPFLNFRIQ